STSGSHVIRAAAPNPSADSDFRRIFSRAASQAAVPAMESSSSLACPSAYRSATSTALLLRSSARSGQTLRQQATAKRRSFRSLSLPSLRSHLSSFSGSLQLSQSDSVTGSLLPQQQVYHPTAPDVRPWLAAVRQNVGVSASGFIESVGQYRQAVEG